MKYRLQKYEDGTYGYLGIDGNEKYNLTTDSPVVCMQGEEEDREEFIAKNNITFHTEHNLKGVVFRQYGSDEKLDRQVNDKSVNARKAMANQGYGLDKLINDEKDTVRERVAFQGYKADKLVYDKNEKISAAARWYLGGYGLIPFDLLALDEEIE